MPTVLLKPLSPNEKEVKFEVKSGKLLYDELERQGFILPHGCLAGSCGSCRIEILDGARNLSNPGAVEADTISHIEATYSPNKIIRLSCRSRVNGDISFSILK